MKTCSACRIVKDQSEFYRDHRTLDGLKSQCKRCHCKGNVRTRNVDLHRVRRRESMARRRMENPELFRSRERRRPRRAGLKVDARKIVNQALRIGALVRPTQCEDCRESKKLTAHHADYEKPLDVNWLCYLCHAKWHRLSKRVEAP